MFFSKSFSNKSVEKAVNWLRFLDMHLRDLLNIFETKYTEEIYDDFYEDRDKYRCFGHGCISVVLDYFFDGEPKHFKNYEKKAIIEAFNFGSNDGSAVYKNYSKSHLNFIQYKNLGEKWTKKFFIKNVVEEDLTFEEVQETYDSSLDDDDQIDLDNSIPPELELATDLQEEKNIDDDERKFNQIKSMFGNITKGNEKRFKLYQELFELQRNDNPIIYDKKNWDYLSKINFNNFDNEYSPEFKNKLNSFSPNLADRYLYQHKRINLSLLVPELIFNVLKMHGFPVEINSYIPSDEGFTKDSKYYPAYKKFPFFKLRDILEKNTINKNLDDWYYNWYYLNFSELGLEFPKYGRLIMSPNLSIIFQVNIKIADKNLNLYMSENDLSLLEKIQDEDLNDEKISKYDYLKIQDVRSAKHQIENKYDSYWLHTRLSTFTNGLYNNTYLKYEKVFDQQNKTKGSQNSEIDFNKIMLSLMDDIGDLNERFSVDQSIISKSSKKEEFYNENGSYYDDFDVEVFEKLNEYNFNLDINNLRKKCGFLPVSVELALILERMIAPYINEYKFYKKYNNLYSEIEDYNSIDISYHFRTKL